MKVKELQIEKNEEECKSWNGNLKQIPELKMESDTNTSYKCPCEYGICDECEIIGQA